jgi:putative lipoprotein
VKTSLPLVALALVVLSITPLPVFAAAPEAPKAPAADAKPQEVKILRQWHGGVAPGPPWLFLKDQTDTPAGFLADAQAFSQFWRLMMMGKPENPPEVDFKANLILYTRDTTILNANPIYKVTLTDGVLEAFIDPPAAQVPVEFTQNVALVEVSRAGARAVRCGPNLLLAVPPAEAAKEAPKEPTPPPARQLPTISGTVVFEKPLILGSEATAEISLLDISTADAPARTLGKQVIKDPKKFPFPFAVPYDPEAIKPAGRYAISVRLTLAGGQLLFTSDTATPVLTNGQTKDIKVTVVRVKQP